MESYLLQNDVLDIAKRNGVQAIHPGYGFLSENSGFASATESAGITFIGPGPEAILAMGSKSHSKRLMEDANVPTTPGYHGLNQNPEYLLHEAVNIGFPLLIKGETFVMKYVIDNLNIIGSYDDDSSFQQQWEEEGKE